LATTLVVVGAGAAVVVGAAAVVPAAPAGAADLVLAAPVVVPAAPALVAAALVLVAAAPLLVAAAPLELPPPQAVATRAHATSAASDPLGRRDEALMVVPFKNVDGFDDVPDDGETQLQSLP
jgi:hypothetical protein